MPRPPARRGLAALLVALGLSVATAGCVSMPGGGPVQPYPVAQGAEAPNQNYYQVVPQPPAQNATPSQIVAGFLAAGASFAGQQQVAREYLTPQASREWKPIWSATVYKAGPTVSSARLAAGRDTASVTVGGSPQATLSSHGKYAVQGETPNKKTYRYDLVKNSSGQWRISNAHDNPLLLTSTEFSIDYQLADLYFFDPSRHYLVPDPVYVPLQATQGALVNGLVQDLINQPTDWLGEAEAPSTATYSAFPARTSLQGAVSVDGGTASVNLTGSAISRASLTVKQQISAQLLCTLTGACQGQQQQVKSVALYINGHAFVPPGAAGNPVQHQAQYQPAATSKASGLYYLTASGQLEMLAKPQAKPVTLASVGPGSSSLAVSPDGKYLALLRKGNLYTGTVGGASLASRGPGSGITSLSWDSSDHLWVANGGAVFVLTATPGKPASSPVPVSIFSSSYPNNSCGSNPNDVTALRVAPDGVRVAMVYGGSQETLAFGAIARSGPSTQPLIVVNLSPFFVCKAAGAFTSLSWYGADDVVALSGSGSAVTDYPVNGGTPTPLEAPQAASTSITASAGFGLVVAGRGTISSAAGLSSAWGSLGAGLSPAFPG
ncbi:MAG TPA: LpqB family beta-propeller domain-containing protein [Trebonia sp.]|nr:LpqB family beta-propeller domain-containing protein [Trebonia sp.]